MPDAPPFPTPRTVDLGPGPIAYVDTGGDGPVLVLTHGFPMDHLQWRKVVPLLADYRCILPTLPLGAHRAPMAPDADLSQVGQAHLVADLLEALDLHDVTLVMNDWGGPQFLVSEGRADRVGRLAFASCEAFDNFPPAPVRPLIALLGVPGGGRLLMRLLRRPFFRHNRRTFGGLTSTGVPDAVLDAWFRPATTDPSVRRDLVKFATSTPGRAELLERAERLADFPGDVLVIWGEEDRMMPRAHADRLAAMFGRGPAVVIPGSGTLLPEDRPEELAAALRAFLERSRPTPPHP